MVEARIKEQQHLKQQHAKEVACSKFMTDRSDVLATHRYTESLSEIFDILLLSVQMSLRAQEEGLRPSTPVRTGDLGSIIDQDLKIVNDILDAKTSNEAAGEGKKARPSTFLAGDRKKQSLLEELSQPVSFLSNNSSPSPATTVKEVRGRCQRPVNNAVLDTSLARAELLKPKVLSEAIGQVLEKRKPGTFTRDQFIFAVRAASPLYLFVRVPS